MPADSWPRSETSSSPAPPGPMWSIWPSSSPPSARAFYNPPNCPHGREVRLADGEPPDDEGHSPPGEPAQAETPVTSEAGMAPAEAPPGNPLEQHARLAEDCVASGIDAARHAKKG